VSTNDATIATPVGRARTQTGLRPRLGALARTADARALALLTTLFAVLVAVSWRKWGTPEIDAGAELTTAAQAVHGHLPYDDVRYFYGPLGIYALAGVMKVFGASLTVAFGMGLVLTLAIVVSFYALARQALTPLVAGLSTAMLLAIGFSGTQFNFVLPHTNSATFGLLLLLLELLALARGRMLLAGTAAGLLVLTRVEFAAAAGLVLAAWVVGTWRAEGRREALRVARLLIGPAIAIPVVALGVLSAQVGASRLFWQNLWPVDFLKVAGFNAYREWTPFDAASVASTAARAVIYLALLAGVVASAVRVSGARGLGRVKALWPLLAAVVFVGLVDAAWRVVGIFPEARDAVQTESRQLLLGMSWLPALSLGAAAIVAWRFLRRRDPLSGSWPLDLSVAAAALMLTSRAYDEFTMTSAAPYYAAPAILILGLLHQRLAQRYPAARVAVLGALAVAIAGIAVYTHFALYADKSVVVHSAAGSYVSESRSAGAQQQVLDFVRAHTAPGDAVLALPADGGMAFLTDRDPALYEVMFLPGLLDTRADETAAIARLKREHVRYAVISARDTSAFDTGRFGEGYNRVLGDYLRSGRLVATFGNPHDAAGGGYPSRGFQVYQLPA
jgi:4-amino-4-deoxy-L-arabinose transferase-like glycosyltransferase